MDAWILQKRKEKVVGDGGQFIKHCALDFVEIYWSWYHNPYASPHEISLLMDAWFFRYGKNKFSLCIMAVV